jgi:hypothetical protein
VVTEEDSMQLRPFLGRTLVSLLLCHGFAADAAIADVLEQLKTAQTIPLKSAPPIPTQLGK